MSKQMKRKITVDSSGKPPETARPSVFERLGTKKAASKKAGGEREHCRQWAAHGVCAYGKGCKFAGTHTLVSPSKARAAGKDEGGGGARLHSAVVRAAELDAWDQSELEYADTDVLEKRRQQLQRELELQLKMESGKAERRGARRPASSSSSSRSSSSSNSSSSSGGSSSSSTSGRDRKKGKKGKLKRNSSSSSDGESPSKKKKLSKDTAPRSKSASNKKISTKKDDRLKKRESSATKKKTTLLKLTLGKKSMSPGKKTSATPPISKVLAKTYTRKQSKSPARKDKNRSVSPSREKERDRLREREKERDKERDRVRGKSRSVQRKARSRSPHRSREPVRRKDSSERTRPASPKKARKDPSPDKHRKSPTRDRRDAKDRSVDRRKDEKDRQEREKLLARQRERDRPKEVKRETAKRGRDRREADRGLEKPSKPMERLLPRPEERLAALAAISNRNVEQDKSSTTSKDRQDSERGRKLDRSDRDRRDRSSKRDRMSMERDHGDYDRGLDRGYDRGHSLERGYDRGERYDDMAREGENRSPGYGRERHYDPGYDMPGHPRYPEDEDRGYGERMGDHRDMGFEERRRREHSWEGSVERERPYHPHPHKEWEGEEFHAGTEWGRERHWQHRDQQQLGEWVDKESEVEPGWHHRGHPPPAHRNRMHDDGYRRMDHRDMPNKRRPVPQPSRIEADAPPVMKPEAPSAAPQAETPAQETEDLPIPDDLSEISDDPDDILNQDDMVERSDAESRAGRAGSDEQAVKCEPPSETHTNHSQESLAAESPTAKPESTEAKEDEDMKPLDFEEISDGELEEERTRARLGSALGVDWASLVAEVRRGQAGGAVTGAQRRWRAVCVLAAVGVSVSMAGEKMAAEAVAGSEEDAEAVRPAHPVASIQVAMERRKRQRAALFGSGCDVTRALSARRDLALRRHLCNLPPAERGSVRGAPQPHLLQAARALLLKT